MSKPTDGSKDQDPAGRDIDSPIGQAAGAVDARNAMGVQVGAHNTQIIYTYNPLTWTPRTSAPPLISVSGDIHSPYRGLNTFDERDAGLFFGREEATDGILSRMSARIDGPALVVVSGVSGAGKSSLLRAGVLPRLRGSGLEAAPEATRWPCLIFTPTRHPLDQLAVMVAAVHGGDAVAIRRELEDNPAGFALLSRQAALQQATPAAPNRAQPRLLLIIDQFEQIFTQCDDERERRGFIEGLHAASAGSTPGILAVLAVRADFEARCADYPELSAPVQDRFLVTPMTQRQLRIAIVEPAKRAGSFVEPELVTAVLDEINSRTQWPGPALSGAPTSGVLPLLSHALERAWTHRAGPALTLADYERVGGIERAIADTAQATYDRLPESQRETARRVFLQLVITSPDGTDTADQVVRADLTRGLTSWETADVEQVLEAFARERLLILGPETVELSHEVILTAWPLLRDRWLADSHAERLVRTRLRAAAAEWARQSHDPSYLYSGSLLESASALADTVTIDQARHPPLSTSEQQFLTASLKVAQRGIRRRRALLGGSVIFVLALLSASIIALNFARQAADQRDIAVARQLISESAAADDPTTRTLKALAAWRIQPSAAARHALLQAAAQPGIAVWEAAGARTRDSAVPNPALVEAVAFSPDGRIIASVAGDSVRLWDAESQQEIGPPLTVPGDEFEQVAFSPDGKLIAAAGGSLRIWEAGTHRPIELIPSGSAAVMAFSAPGLLAVGDHRGSLDFWSLASGSRVRKIPAAHKGLTPSL